MQKKWMILPMVSMVITGAVMTNVMAEEIEGGVVVEESAESNTGYNVSFAYRNEEATNVQIMGGFQFYVKDDDNVYGAGYNLEEGDSVENYLINPENWNKEEDLWHVGDSGYIAEMDNEDGVWTYSINLPGGCYLYQYNVSYDGGETYESVIDPANIPYCNELGANQTRSQFFVPYDAENMSENEDWTWLFPVEEETARGTVLHELYSGVDDMELPMEIYLPAGYDEDREDAYKVLYISHGGGGEEGDWFYQGNGSNIVDRLIAEEKCEEFIMVAMNNTLLEWNYDKIFENTKDHLIPYIEENYHVVRAAEGRAFAGLSMGGMTTSEMFYRDPELFAYFGIFSGASTAAFPEVEDYTAYKTPNLYLAAGWEDMALKNDSYQTDSDRTLIGLADKLDEKEISYNAGNGVYIVQGGHDWFTWPQILKNYVETSLWK